MDPLFGCPVIGKIVVGVVTSVNPLSVFITMLVFGPPFKVSVNESPLFGECAFSTNPFMVIRPSADDRV